MDPITRAVREMYEQFPYPAAAGAELRMAFDVRLLLGYGRKAPPAGRGLNALDAGCGKAIGLLGAASVQPDVQFVGIDLNRVALAQATAEAKRLGLANVRFQEVDLMTLDGLEIPPGGFDVIYSSGVVHHLASPADGLRCLANALAPHGVMAFMVYGRRGREPVHRLAEAVDLLIGRDRPLPERLEVLRGLVRQGGSETVEVGPFRDLAHTDEVELVDRYLNVNENSYDVPGVFSLLQQTGLRFLRWTEPFDWAVETLIPPGPVLERALALPALAQFELVDRLRFRHRLELIIAHGDNGPRPSPTAATLDRAMLAVNPQVTLQVETRNLHAAQRIESLTYRLRAQPLIPVKTGALANAMLLLRGQLDPFSGEWLTASLQRSGLSKDQAVQTALELLAREILYSPHGAARD